jgi:transcriptional regulator with XRE-family HTH domain
MPRARNDQLISAFSQVLLSARREADLTQEQLAHEAEIDPTFVSLLERGRRQPTLSVLFAVSGVLGVKPETLVQRTRRVFEELVAE